MRKEPYQVKGPKKKRYSYKEMFRYVNIHFPGDIAIFRDYVILLSLKEDPIAILITSKELAKEYKTFFIGLWKSAK